MNKSRRSSPSSSRGFFRPALLSSLGLLLLARTFHGCVGFEIYEEESSTAAGGTLRGDPLLRRDLKTDGSTTEDATTTETEDVTTQGWKNPSSWGDGYDKYLNSAFRDFYLSERECGSVINEYHTVSEIQTFIGTLLEIIRQFFKFSPDAPINYDNFWEPLIKTYGDISSVDVTNGFKSMKICAKCEMFRYSKIDGYDEICGSDVYGSDAVFSGLLLIPMSDEDTVLEGLLELVVHGHGIQTKTTKVPSVYFEENLASQVEPSMLNPQSRAFISYDYLSAIMAAGTGRVVLLPDYVGFAQSNDRYKGILVKKTYQTATVPLVLRAVKMIAKKTGCATEVADVAYTTGNSEGGYSSIAIADGLRRIGFRVGLAQAGSPIISIEDLTDNVVGGLLLGMFNPTYNYVLVPFASAFSTTNPDLANYGIEGQNVASDDYRDRAISWTMSQLEIPEMRLLVTTVPPSEGDEIIDTLNPTIVSTVNATGEVCGDPESAGLVDLCRAFEDNTLTESYDDRYPIYRCNSPTDDLVGFEPTVGTSVLLPNATAWGDGNPPYPHLTASIVCVAIQGYTFERGNIPPVEDVKPFRFGKKRNRWCRQWRP